MDISKPRIVLLPQDREIMEITGFTAEQYRDFCLQCYKASRSIPGDQPTAFDPITFAITLIIGLALSYVATLLAPRPQPPEEPPDVRNEGGQQLTNGARFAPTSGFDSVQNVVEVGSLVPLVYANRRLVDGIYYGGVRVNTNLLWSQLYSVGGGQLLRGVFLVGEGTVPEPDPEQYAIGDNLINNFDLAPLPGDETSRVALYYVDGSNSDNNRIRSGDFIRGRLPAQDLGNAEAAGAADVFQARIDGTNFAPDFCYASTPSNQTEFGVYGFVGNNLPFRLSPRIKPAENYDNQPRKENAQGKSDRMRDVWRYYGRSGIHELNGAAVTGLQTLAVNDTVTFTIFNDSDARGLFKYQISGPDGKTSVKDVASSIASRQNGFDDQIVLGDRYLVGTAVAVCTARTTQPFQSEMANIPIGGGNSVQATFRITDPGQVHIYEEASLHPVPRTVTTPFYDLGDFTAFPSSAGNPGTVLVPAGNDFEIDDGVTFQELGTSNLDSALKLSGKLETDPEGDIYGPYFVVAKPANGIQVALTKGGAALAINGNGGSGGANTPGAGNVIRLAFTSTPNKEPAFAPPLTASNSTHIMRVAEGYFSVERSSRFVEVGLRSTVNLQMSGATNYRDIADGNEVRTMSQIDDDMVDDNIAFTSGTYSSPETRFSCFRVSFRSTDSSGYTVIPEIFAVRSMMDTPAYNYLRFDMASVNTWEFKFVPVSSYEARNSTQPINVLDYKLANIANVTSVGVTVSFSGVAGLTRGTAEDASNFAVPILTTIDGDPIVDKGGKNLDFDDEINGGGRDYFSDAYARLAEFFMHNELTTTARSPENQIVYVNTQTSNPQTPLYSNLAMVGMNIRSSREISSLQQLSVYCNQGIGSTNLFPEVLLDLFTNDRYGTGKILNAQQIDTTSFNEMAAWCEDRRYFFDGVVDSKVNIRSWGTEVAKNYLLDLVVRNGKFALQPVADFGVNPQITALFSAGNVIDESFEFTTSEEQDRVRPRVSVRWREEKANNTNGLFPVVRQVTVREAGTPDDAPLESIDLSAYCTSERQAIDVAKYTCRARRLITHSVSFSTTPTEAALDIGSVFKLGMESISFNQPQNGAISTTGEVTAWPPLDDGIYDVLLWDGATNAVQETSITVAGGSAAQRNSVFCLRSGTNRAETYKTQALSYDEDGNIQVEATVYPCNDDGASLLTEGWDVAANWEIEGQRT